MNDMLENFFKDNNNKQEIKEIDNDLKNVLYYLVDMQVQFNESIEFYPENANVARVLTDIVNTIRNRNVDIAAVVDRARRRWI